MNITPYINKETKTLYLNKVVDHKHILKIAEELKGVPCNVYITAVTEKELDDILTYKKLSIEDKSKLQDKYLHINLSNIIMLGNANKPNTSYTNMEGLLDSYTKTDRERLASNLRYNSVFQFYRNYEVRKEEWENQRALLNPCPDIKMSWQSAIRKLGAKEVHGLKNEYIPFYAVLWFDTLTDSEIKEIYKL